MNKTIIRVRRGINGFKYSACDSNGYFLGNFEKLGDVRKHWKIEIRRGQIELVRELDKHPDMSKIEETREMIDCYLRSLSKKSNKRKK
jgi:hypothetical protein